MAPPLRVTLDQAAHDELERRYHTTHDATTRTRYQMLLLRADGHRVPEVAQLTCCSPDTVRRVGSKSCSGAPTWIRARWASTVRVLRGGVRPTAWLSRPGMGRGSRRCGS